MNKILIVLNLLILLSCNNEGNFKEKNQETTILKTSGKIDSLKALFDTISLSTGRHLSRAEFSQYMTKKGREKNNTDYVVIPYPPTTKLIDWYYIGHAPMGSGNLVVICHDKSTYSVPIADPVSIAAVSSLMQAAYVRIDSLSKEIYSYKSPIN